MTTIVDYASLNTAVAQWMRRTGDTTITSVIPDAIGLAEGLMSSKIKSRAMETRSSLSTIAGNAYVALPTDLIEARRLNITSTDPVKGLRYVTPDDITRTHPFSTTGLPEVWTVIGSNVQLGCIPDSIYTLELTYLQRIPALTSGATTNWLILAYPNVYLWGTLSQMAIFANDPKRVAQYAELFQAGIDAINLTDWYSGTTMSVRSA